jgi:hypothetical protein
MDAFGGLVVVVVFIGLGIVAWVAAKSLDKTRITDYVRERGGRIVSITWAPFGAGWFGEKNSRIYEVVQDVDVHRRVLDRGPRQPS